MTKKRILSILLALTMIFQLLPAAQPVLAAEEKTVNPTDSFSYVNLEYEYSCSDGEQRTFYTLYNDGMLMTNSFVESPDLVRLTVALAAAAYSSEEIIGMLRQMEFKPVNTAPDDPEDVGEDADFLYNYDRTATYEDNDFVGYSIGRKQIDYNGTRYYAYVISVRGTPSSPEWYSNFNLGDRSDGYHEGFKLAADEIISTIKNTVHTENNIYLLTGHSRGAAVANIVAGEFCRGQVKDDINTTQLFCYTFACPAVIDAPLAVTTAPCIRNYNNAGDAITVMPLPDWGYARYGTDIELSLDKDNLSNFCEQFLRIHRKEYQGALNTEKFVSLLSMIARTPEAFNSKENRFLRDVAAWGLGDLSMDTLTKILKKYGYPTKGKIQKFLKKFAWESVQGMWASATDEEYNDAKLLLSEINIFLEETRNVTDEEEFMEQFRKNAVSQRINEEMEEDPQTREEVILVKNKLDKEIADVSFIDANVEEIFHFIFSNSGNHVVNEIWHAHTGETYIQWINSMFYGFEGWKGNSSVTEFTAPDQYYIGKDCFYGCSNLESITITSTSGVVAPGAFAGCKGKEITLTMPIDSEGVSPLAFGSSNNQTINPHDISNITTLCYTAGDTGVQRDRKPWTDTEGDGIYYMDVPEYYLRSVVKSIVFEEGVKRIGAYAWEDSDRDSMWGYYTDPCRLESVSWPGTLESVGEYAFYGRDLSNDSFLETVKEIGAMAFYDSQFTGTCVIGGPNERIGSQSLYNAHYSELIIENTDVQLENVFNYPIDKVTIPVDMINAAAAIGRVNIQGTIFSTKEVHYTPGKTGVMPDRKAYSSGEDNRFFFSSIEGKAKYIEKIIFEEGITAVCQSSFVRGTVQLPKSLTTIKEDLRGRQEYDTEGAYSLYVTIPSCKAIYGYPDTVAKTYAGTNGIKFIPLHEPQLETDEIVAEHGSTQTIPVTVYTGIDETTDKVNWSIEGAKSSATTIDSEGTLTIGEDEPAWSPIYVTAEYDGYESRLRVYVDKKAYWNTVELDLGGGALPEGEEAVLHVEMGTCAKDTEIPVPTMKGYLFDHWYYYYDIDGALLEKELSDEDTFDQIYTLYAAWTEDDTPEPVEIPVEEITVSDEYVEIAVGNTYQLFLSILPENATNQKITWSSEDEAVAAVDENGVVTAKKYGNVLIFAEVDGLTVSCEIQTLFKDVANHAKSYFDPVYWAVDNGITTCTVSFRPDDSVNRGEFTAFLYRLAGKPPVSSVTKKFSDVTKSTKFAKEITWAVNEGIIKGYSDKTFRPTDSITRAQTAIMIWRYAGRPASTLTESPFPDVDFNTSDTSRAILWGNENGIIKGSKGYFLPKDSCTRGQVVTFLYRYNDKFDVIQ